MDINNLSKYLHRNAQPTQQYVDLQNQNAALQSQLQQQQTVQQWLNQSKNYQPITPYSQVNNPWLYSFQYQPQQFNQQANTQQSNGLNPSGINYGSGLLGMFGNTSESK